MSDIETLEVENRMLRERNERLEKEVKELTSDLKAVIKAYRELLLKYDKIEERIQK